MRKTKTFFKEYDDMLEQYIEDSIVKLKRTNPKYKSLYREFNKILEENENLAWILEGDFKGRNLSDKEYLLLPKLIKLYFDMQTIEEKEIFFLGCKEMYFIFKKIGVLR